MGKKSCAASAAVLAVMLSTTAMAQESAKEPPRDSAFDLGRIVVTSPRADGVQISGETLTSAAMEVFQRRHLDDAINLMPGVSASNSGGSRNERLVYVRGFDRYQVPVSIDGVRVYLPYDNRLDYGRFLTADIAEVQVAKGYASVIDGPGALGGAINLVTRKPSQALEYRAGATLELDRDAGYAGYSAFGLIGTRQDTWYAQASYTRDFRDHWDLPSDFVPTTHQPSGERRLSRTSDWRVNAKLGYTPNATDEYSISYTRQEGSKNAPPHVTSPSAQAWAWPYWNLDSIYFLSTTALGDGLALKTRAYRNSFDNLLRGFDDFDQDSQTLAAGRVFNSWYNDESLGGSATLEWVRGSNRLSAAVHYRRDEHIEYSQVFPTAFIEPEQRSLEDTMSVAVENRLDLSPRLRLTVGASYDWRNLKQSDEYALNGTRDGGTLFGYPLVDSDSWNGQGRVDYTVQDGTSLHASLSSRSRFPTLAERFSSRFGGATSNPDLKAERATNIEVGATHTLGPVELEANAFHSWLDDAIVSFPFVYQNTNVSQSRNVGKGRYYGVELAANARLSAALAVGANYTWTKRNFTDPSISAFEETGVPTHKGFAWASWTPTDRLTITPSVDVASDRWTVNPAGTLYYRTGDYMQGNLNIDYRLFDTVVLGAGVRNAFDDLYYLTDGFPEAGRKFYVSITLK